MVEYVLKSYVVSLPENWLNGSFDERGVESCNGRSLSGVWGRLYFTRGRLAGFWGLLGFYWGVLI